MFYDYIEIGTSDFDTEIQKNDNRTGLSIEAVKYYLEQLPEKVGCKKYTRVLVIMMEKESSIIFQKILLINIHLPIVIRE
jgi:hypothetical protein